MLKNSSIVQKRRMIGRPKGRELRIIIINLERAVERRQRLAASLGELGLVPEFLVATDAKHIPEEELVRLANFWPRPINGKDIACFKSHQRAWEIIANGDEPILICEDDIIHSPALPSVLSKIEKTICGLEMYDLEAVPRKHLLGKKPCWIEDGAHAFSAFKIYQNKNGAGAYVITPEVARKLIVATKDRFVLADAYVWTRNWAKSYQIEPAPVFQDIYAESLMNGEAEIYPSNVSEKTYGRSKLHPLSRLRRMVQKINMIPGFLAGSIFGRRRYIEINTGEFLRNTNCGPV